MLNFDGSRDWARYKNTWTLANGNSAVGFDLSGVLAVAPTTDMVNVVLTEAPSGFSEYWVTVSGSTVTINTNSAATADIDFSITVSVY